MSDNYDFDEITFAILKKELLWKKDQFINFKRSITKPVGTMTKKQKEEKSKEQQEDFVKKKLADDKYDTIKQLVKLYTQEVQKRRLKNVGGGGSSEELEILTDQIEEYKNAISRSKEHIVKMKEKIKRFVEERKGYESVMYDKTMKEEQMSKELSKFKDKLKQAERIMWDSRADINYKFHFYGEGGFQMTPEDEDFEGDELNYWDKPAGVQQGGSSEVKRWSKKFATEEEENEYYSDENIAKRYEEQKAKELAKKQSA